MIVALFQYASFQVFLFTASIPHKREEFFHNSREVFENHFLLGIEGDNVQGVYTIFSTQDVFTRFDHICENVSTFKLLAS